MQSEDPISSLKQAIAQAELRQESAKESDQAGVSPAGMVMRVGVELLAGVAVGAGFGWWLDQKLGSKPFAMLIFFFVGVAASVANLIRIARQTAINTEK